MQVYPLLHGYAVPHFAIQSTSVPSEKVFRTAGDIISKKRNQISPGTVKTTMFLNKNLWCSSKEVLASGA